MSQENASSKPLIRYVNRQQMSWRAVDVERLIGEEHAARAIWTLVGRLDLSLFYRGIESSTEEGGRPAFDPQLLISLWVYAYSQGIGALREVARRSEYDPAFQWADGTAASELSHAGGFSRGEAERVGRVVHAGVGGAQQRRTDHAGTGDAGRHEDQGIGEHAELSTERNDSGASGAGAAARGGDRRSTERREQSESQASPGTRAARATRAAGERIGRVAEVAGAQERKEGQERNAREHERSAGAGDAPLRWGLSLSYNAQISTDAAHGRIVGVAVTQAVNDY